MTSFKQRYKNFKREHSPIGNPTVEEFEIVIDDSGKKKMVSTGFTDIQDYIESYADSVDINIIVNRYMSGDTDVIERLEGMYADVSGMPRNLMDVLNTNMKVENAFNQLPAEVKEIYNNNYMEFLQDPYRYQPDVKETEQVSEVVSNDNEE